MKKTGMLTVIGHFGRGSKPAMGSEMGVENRISVTVPGGRAPFACIGAPI